MCRAAYLNRPWEEKVTEPPTGPRFSPKSSLRWIYTPAVSALGGRGRRIKNSSLFWGRCDPSTNIK